MPRDPEGVGLYVCGLTVYDDAHIGHARTYVGFEVIRRWLEHRFGKVHYVQNVTDVDDKIVARAKEKGVSPRELAAEWDAKCRTEMERLGIRVPTGADHPHVTRSIPDILRFIATIVDKKFAYVTPEGNVYFDVPGYEAHAAANFKDDKGRACGYGRLSNRDYREMAAGTRKDVEGDKRHPADFALWKAGEPGDHPDANWDPARETPNVAKGTLKGVLPGRPGWHIECSLMSTRALGDQFDIHGGGQDLIFPHHENEIAQSQAKTGKAPFVNVWLHTGFLNVEGEKMSKSLGNFITLREMLDELEAKGRGADVLRFYFLQTHYRSKIDFTRKGLDEAAAALAALRRTRDNLAQASGTGVPDHGLAEAARRLEADFEKAMDNDLHTPGALASLFEFQREANRALDGGVGAVAGRAAAGAMDAAAQHLSIWTPLQEGDVPNALRDVARRFHVAGATEREIMEGLLQARAAARAAKVWKTSDEIREAAKAAGYVIEDAPMGQRWRRA